MVDAQKLAELAERQPLYYAQVHTLAQECVSALTSESKEQISVRRLKRFHENMEDLGILNENSVKTTLLQDMEKLASLTEKEALSKSERFW